MFTGIVEETGTVVETTTHDDGRRLTIESSFGTELSEGQSVAVNGVCLTVERYDERTFEVFLAAETIDRTYLDAVTSGDAVNLERAMATNDRFDGHIVQGHVDGTATITAIESVGEDWTFEFAIPASLEQYVVEKGSIALDGISLTVASHTFGTDETTPGLSVAIIPATYGATTLGKKSVGDPVHVEVDVLAKYTERLLETNESKEATVPPFSQ
ncbi:riboflavin synthase [Halocatena halophila]|uniref:riboflavin synthase n=1 Tax=Halocatena halophila TaxID=2814576 RepID=UPI002ED0D535